DADVPLHGELAQLDAHEAGGEAPALEPAGQRALAVEEVVPVAREALHREGGAHQHLVEEKLDGGGPGPEPPQHPGPEKAPPPSPRSQGASTSPPPPPCPRGRGAARR